MLRVEKIQPISQLKNSLYRDPRFNYNGQQQSQQQQQQQQPQRDTFQSVLEQKIEETQKEQPKQLTLKRTPHTGYSGFDRYV